MSNKPKTLQHFIDTYVNGSEENQIIAEYLLNHLFRDITQPSTIEARGGLTRETALETAIDTSAMTHQLFGHISSTLKSNAPLKERLDSLSKPFNVDVKHLGHTSRSIIQVTPTDFLPHLAALTLTVMEGSRDDLPDLVRDSVRKINGANTPELAAQMVNHNSLPSGLQTAVRELRDEIKLFGGRDKPVRVVAELMEKLNAEIKAVRSGDGPSPMGGGGGSASGPQDRYERGMF